MYSIALAMAVGVTWSSITLGPISITSSTKNDVFAIFGQSTPVLEKQGSAIYCYAQSDGSIVAIEIDEIINRDRVKRILHQKRFPYDCKASKGQHSLSLNRLALGNSERQVVKELGVPVKKEDLGVLTKIGYVEKKSIKIPDWQISEYIKNYPQFATDYVSDPYYTQVFELLVTFKENEAIEYSYAFTA